MVLYESLCIGAWSGFVLSTVTYTPIRVIRRVCDVRCMYIVYNIYITLDLVIQLIQVCTQICSYQVYNNDNHERGLSLITILLYMLLRNPRRVVVTGTPCFNNVYHVMCGPHHGYHNIIIIYLSIIRTTKNSDNVDSQAYLRPIFATINL